VRESVRDGRGAGCGFSSGGFGGISLFENRGNKSSRIASW